jgi:dolichol-phosphate mannosyltransferase
MNLFVDDGSTEGSPRLIDDLCAAQGRFRALHVKAHGGQSAALFAGFQAARHAITIALDADLQNDPRDIFRLLEHMSQYDCVCGWRQSRQDNFGRRVQSKIGNAVRNWVLGESLADAACTLKAYRTDLLQRINLFQGGHRFLATLMALEGARVLEVPVRHRPRAAGVSKVPCGRRAVRATIDLLGVWWMKSRAMRQRVASEVNGGSQRRREWD